MAVRGRVRLQPFVANCATRCSERDARPRPVACPLRGGQHPLPPHHSQGLRVHSDQPLVAVALLGCGAHRPSLPGRAIRPTETRGLPKWNREVPIMRGGSRWTTARRRGAGAFGTKQLPEAAQPNCLGPWCNWERDCLKRSSRGFESLRVHRAPTRFSSGLPRRLLALAQNVA